MGSNNIKIIRTGSVEGIAFFLICQRKSSKVFTRLCCNQAGLNTNYSQCFRQPTVEDVKEEQWHVESYPSTCPQYLRLVLTLVTTPSNSSNRLTSTWHLAPREVAPGTHHLAPMRGDMGEVSQGLADVSLTPGREPRVRGTRTDAFAGESQALDEIAKQVGLHRIVGVEQVLSRKHSWAVCNVQFVFRSMTIFVMTCQTVHPV